MSNEIIKQLQREITRLENDKEDYYADGGSTNGYVMSLVGQIQGIKTAINLIKEGK